MPKFLLALAVFLAGCSTAIPGFTNPFDPAALIAAASKDPANFELQAAYMGGTVTFKRSNPNPVSSCPVVQPTPAN